MSNLNELVVPEGSDEIIEWAMRREFGLRRYSFAEATLWGVVENASVNCVTPSIGAYELNDPKHPEFHSIHAGIWDAREGK